MDSEALALVQAAASCPDVALPGASELKTSDRDKSCEETFGSSWTTASTAQMRAYCGCEADGFCKCEPKLKPFGMVTWGIYSLTDGQALGPGYKYEVKNTEEGQAAKGGIDMCMECPAPAPAPTPAPTPAPAPPAEEQVEAADGMSD